MPDTSLPSVQRFASKHESRSPKTRLAKLFSGSTTGNPALFRNFREASSSSVDVLLTSSSARVIWIVGAGSLRFGGALPRLILSAAYTRGMPKIENSNFIFEGMEDWPCRGTPPCTPNHACGPPRYACGRHGPGQSDRFRSDAYQAGNP